MTTEVIMNGQLPNYMVKILEGYQEHPEWYMPGKLVRLHIFHDEWCAIYEGGACNCNPDIKPELMEQDATKLDEAILKYTEALEDKREHYSTLYYEEEVKAGRVGECEKV